MDEKWSEDSVYGDDYSVQTGEPLSYPTHPTLKSFPKSNSTEATEQSAENRRDPTSKIFIHHIL